MLPVYLALWSLCIYFLGSCEKSDVSVEGRDYLSYSHHVLRKSSECDNSDVFLTSTARGDQTTIVILSVLQQYEEHSLDGEASNAVVRYILFYINWCKRCLDMILSIHMCTLCNQL